MTAAAYHRRRAAEAGIANLRAQIGFVFSPPLHLRAGEIGFVPAIFFPKSVTPFQFVCSTAPPPREIGFVSLNSANAPPARADYNTKTMHHRRSRPYILAILSAVALAVAASAQAPKRPLNHHDYDSWRAIAGQKLTNDGHFLVYGLFPQDGDGQVVVRNLITGAETPFPAGSRPAPTPAATPEEGPTETRTFTIDLSADSKTAVFAAFPAKAEIAQAKKDKKPAPTDAMVIVDLASGKSTRVEKVRRFAMPEDASGYVAYLKQSANAPAADAPKPEPGNDADQQGGRGGRGGAAGGRRPRPVRLRNGGPLARR